MYDQELSIIDGQFRRVCGLRKKILKEQNKDLINPLKWLVEGVGALLTIPLYLIKELGLFGEGTYLKILGSKLFKVAKGALALYGVLETLITLLMGKSITVEFIERLTQ